MDSNTPSVSFMSILDFSEDARWLFLTASVSDLLDILFWLLGFEPQELIGRPAMELVHPDEFIQLRRMHYDTITQDKAAVLAYFRLRHKDPYKGYIVCSVSRTVVHSVLVCSVALAIPGPKAMHNASTAQEIEVVTPFAKEFEFRRWNDPSPMSPNLNDFVMTTPGSSTQGSPVATPNDTTNPSLQSPNPINFEPLPLQSARVALILDRFTVNCTINYCSNDLFMSSMQSIGRPFFDFVAQEDSVIVRKWIDMVKSWGVNERGQPSDGGFGFGQFLLLPQGRDSSELNADSPVSRQRTNLGASRGQLNRNHPSQSSSYIRTRAPLSSNEPFKVDAIFSAHSDGLMVILRRRI